MGAVDEYNKYGYKVYETQKGTKCFSFYEYMITQHLEENNIEFQKEMHYSLVIDSDNTNRKFDWCIETGSKKVYIEMFGIERNTYYNEKTISKINDCKENDVELIALFPRDINFNNVGYILDHILGYYKIIDKHDIDEKLVHKFLVNHPDWSHEEYIKQAI
jgi:hypothetical protein